MRFLLHSFCRNTHLNMTSYYGLPDECNETPFACTAGSQVYFTYGHVRDHFVSYAVQAAPASVSFPPSPLPGTSPSDRTLYVFMVREPMSWLLSRHQHSIRKMQVNLKTMTKRQRQKHLQQLPSLVDTAVQFGAKYFNFLPDAERDAAVAWFQRAVDSAARAQALRQSVGATDGSSYNSSSGSFSGAAGVSASMRPFQLATSPAGLSASLDALLFQPLRPVGRGEETRGTAVLVLLTEYYRESLQLLDHVYASSHFSASTGGGAGVQFRNRAQDWQEQGLFSTSPAEMKTLSRLLEVHQALYHACLRAFLRACADMSVEC